MLRSIRHTSFKVLLRVHLWGIKVLNSCHHQLINYFHLARQYSVFGRGKDDFFSLSFHVCYLMRGLGELLHIWWKLWFMEHLFHSLKALLTSDGLNVLLQWCVAPANPGGVKFIQRIYYIAHSFKMVWICFLGESLIFKRTHTLCVFSSAFFGVCVCVCVCVRVLILWGS